MKYTTVALVATASAGWTVRQPHGNDCPKLSHMDVQVAGWNKTNKKWIHNTLSQARENIKTDSENVPNRREVVNNCYKKKGVPAADQWVAARQTLADCGYWYNEWQDAVNQVWRDQCHLRDWKVALGMPVFDATPRHGDTCPALSHSDQQVAGWNRDNWKWIQGVLKSQRSGVRTQKMTTDESREVLDRCFNEHKTPAADRNGMHVTADKCGQWWNEWVQADNELWKSRCELEGWENAIGLPHEPAKCPPLSAEDKKIAGWNKNNQKWIDNVLKMQASGVKTDALTVEGKLEVVARCFKEHDVSDADQAAGKIPKACEQWHSEFTSAYHNLWKTQCHEDAWKEAIHEAQNAVEIDTVSSSNTTYLAAGGVAIVGLAAYLYVQKQQAFKSDDDLYESFVDTETA